MLSLSKNMKSVLYVFLCIVLWALIPVFAKLAQTDLDNYQYIFYSSIVSFLSLFAVSAFSFSFREIKYYSSKTLAFLCFLGFLDFLFYLLLYFGYKYSKYGIEVIVFQYTWPAHIILLSVFLLKERLTLRKVISILLGFAGVIAVITKGNLASLDISNIKVVLTVIFASFCFALFSVLSKTVKTNLTNAVMIYFLSSTIYSFIAVVIFSSLVLPSGKQWFYILINGIFLNGLSYIFWIKALQNANASFVAPFIFFIPLLGVFLMALIFKEPIFISYFVGLVLIVCSGLVNSLDKSVS